MPEIAVNRKHKITSPKELKEQYKNGSVILKPKMSIKRPTETLWGLAKGIVEENPKKITRKAIAIARKVDIPD